MSLIHASIRKLTSDRLDNRIGELSAYGASLVVLLLGFRKLVSLELTETNLFFGSLLVLAVSLLAVNCGLLMGLRAKWSSDLKAEQREV